MICQGQVLNSTYAWATFAKWPVSLLNWRLLQVYFRIGSSKIKHGLILVISDHFLHAGCRTQEQTDGGWTAWESQRRGRCLVAADGVQAPLEVCQLFLCCRRSWLFQTRWVQSEGKNMFSDLTSQSHSDERKVISRWVTRRKTRLFPWDGKTWLQTWNDKQYVCVSWDCRWNVDDLRIRLFAECEDKSGGTLPLQRF